MSQQVIEFLIAYFQRQSDRVIVAGRCCQGPINVGERFHCLYESVVERTEDRYGSSKRQGQGELVNLRVDSIFAYGHCFTQLDPGMTARLELSGEGIEKIKEGLILGIEE